MTKNYSQYINNIVDSPMSKVLQHGSEGACHLEPIYMSTLKQGQLLQYYNALILYNVPVFEQEARHMNR